MLEQKLRHMIEDVREGACHAALSSNGWSRSD